MLDCRPVIWSIGLMAKIWGRIGNLGWEWKILQSISIYIILLIVIWELFKITSSATGPIAGQSRPNRRPSNPNRGTILIDVALYASFTWNLTWRDCDKDMVTRRPLLKLGMSPIAIQSRSNRAPIADSVVCVRVLFYIDCLRSRHNQPCKAKISNRRYCWYSCGNTCGMWYHKRSNIPWMSAWPIAIQSPANRDAAFSNRAALIKHVPT